MRQRPAEQAATSGRKTRGQKRMSLCGLLRLVTPRVGWQEYRSARQVCSDQLVMDVGNKPKKIGDSRQQILQNNLACCRSCHASSVGQAKKMAASRLPFFSFGSVLLTGVFFLPIVFGAMASPVIGILDAEFFRMEHRVEAKLLLRFVIARSQEGRL